MESRTFIIGDIHGELYKLQQCLKSVNFDFKNDKLIQLGDIVDRGFFSFECIELLSAIKNLVCIRGNHDNEWFESLKRGEDSVLYGQGAKQTQWSYVRNNLNPEVHFDFFSNQVDYYLDEENNLFVHGGFNRHKTLEEQEKNIFYWDRDLWLAAVGFEQMVTDTTYKFKTRQQFNEIFIGHTRTLLFGSPTPLHKSNIWNLDTGSGLGGLLTIMNLETKEYKQF